MLANRIRAIREERGISPTELAFRIGRSESALNRYETQTDPPMSIARKIATELDCTLDELFGGQPAEPLAEAA